MHQAHCIIFLSFIAQVFPDVPRVKTKFGIVEGTYKTSEPGSRTFSSFQGIPYALPPKESLRFQPPRPTDVFYKPGSPLAADHCRSECPQIDRSSGEVTGDEDCLYLNVFSPETTFDHSASHPVMVWIHGGAFQFGSSSSDMFGPERLLEEDIVLVTLNYRLGALGFLTSGDSEAPPNVGLLDQRLALQWVRDNIGDFAGDPTQVTLFGESAGAISVMAQLASPGSQGLFHRAIAMSGVWAEAPFLHMSRPPSHYATDLAARLGCEELGDTKQMVSCLRSKETKDIVEESQKFALFDLLPEPFIPVVDDWMETPVLPEPLHLVWKKPLNPKVPLMIGGNKDDGVLFLLQFLKDKELYDRVNENFASELPALLLGVDPDVAKTDEGETATAEVLRNSYLPGDGKLSSEVTSQIIRLFTDVHLLSPIDRVVRDLANTTEGLYYYNYQHQGSFTLPMAFGFWESYGVSHVDELFLLFRFSQVSGSWLGDLALQTPEDITVSRKLVTLWTNFAKTGKPTEDDSWKSVRDSEDIRYTVIDSEEIREEYPEEFRKNMEMVQGMMELVRKHRAFDSETHPALKKMREMEVKFREEKREEKLDDNIEKKKKTDQPDDIDIFDAFDEEDAEFFEHDEL